jgi:hypothetical protein
MLLWREDSETTPAAHVHSGIHIFHTKTTSKIIFLCEMINFFPHFSTQYIFCLNACALQYSLIYSSFYYSSTKEFIYVDRKECKRRVVIFSQLGFLCHGNTINFIIIYPPPPLSTFLLYLHFPFLTLVRA